jgi:serine/threonine protein kinase
VIAEVDEPKGGDVYGPRVHLSEVLDGLDYTRGFQRRYELGEKLGQGHTAEVYVCKSKVTGVRYAVKIFQTRQVSFPLRDAVQSEIAAMRTTQHPNVIRLVDVVVQDAMDEMFIVMELAPEGELFNFIVLKQKLSEEESRKVFSQLVAALAYLVCDSLLLHARAIEMLMFEHDSTKRDGYIAMSNRRT